MENLFSPPRDLIAVCVLVGLVVALYGYLFFTR